METIKLKFRRGVMIAGRRVAPGTVQSVRVGLARELLQRGAADVHDEARAKPTAKKPAKPAKGRKGAAGPGEGEGEGDANPEA